MQSVTQLGEETVSFWARLRRIETRQQPTSKVKISDLTSDIPGLDKLLKHKKRLSKLWQETRDPICKRNLIGSRKQLRMTRKMAQKRWE
jgi:hypothetical protein